MEEICFDFAERAGSWNVLLLFRSSLSPIRPNKVRAQFLPPPRRNGGDSGERRRRGPASGWRPSPPSSAATARCSRPTSSTSSRSSPFPPVDFRRPADGLEGSVRCAECFRPPWLGSRRTGCGSCWTPSGWSASGGSPSRACSSCHPDASRYALLCEHDSVASSRPSRVDGPVSAALQEHWPATLREFVLTARSLVIPRERKAPQSVGFLSWIYPINWVQFVGSTMNFFFWGIREAHMFRPHFSAYFISKFSAHAPHAVVLLGFNEQTNLQYMRLLFS